MRHSAAVLWLPGVWEPHALGAIAQRLSSGRVQDRERAPLQLTSLGLPSAFLIPHLALKIPPCRPVLPVFPRRSIHSHSKEKELGNCVTVPSGDTCPNLPLARATAAEAADPQMDAFPRTLVQVQGNACPPQTCNLWGFFAQLSRLL